MIRILKGRVGFRFGNVVKFDSLVFLLATLKKIDKNFTICEMKKLSKLRSLLENAS